MPGRAPSTKKKRKKKRKTEAVLIFSPSRYLIMLHKRNACIFVPARFKQARSVKGSTRINGEEFDPPLKKP